MSSAAAVATILASSVVVLGGLVALVRSLARLAITIRDNKNATEANTKALGNLKESMDGRLTALEQWRRDVEAHQSKSRS